MKSYDKAAWHIDGGEKKSDVTARFKDIFSFLNEKKMLSNEGKETLEFGMDSSASLNSTMVNSEGKDFLDAYYEVIISQNPRDIKMNLEDAYKKFMDEDERGCSINRCGEKSRM